MPLDFTVNRVFSHNRSSHCESSFLFFLSFFFFFFFINVMFAGELVASQFLD